MADRAKEAGRFPNQACMSKLTRLPAAAATDLACFVSRIFLIGSIAAMGFVGLFLATGGDGRASIMAVETAAGRVESFGLTYAGLSGLVMAAVQAGLVVLAWSCSSWGRERTRKLGLMALVGWAGLWLANSVYLSASTDNMWRDMAAWIMVGVFAAMGIRAVKFWPRSTPNPTEPTKNQGPRWTRCPHRRDEAPTFAGIDTATPQHAA